MRNKCQKKAILRFWKVHEVLRMAVLIAHVLWCNPFFCSSCRWILMQLLQLILPKVCICTTTPLSPPCAAWTLFCASRDRAAPLPLKQTKDRPCRIPMNCSRLKETASPPHLEDEILRGNVFNAIPRKDFWRWWAFQRLHWIDLH